MSTWSQLNFARNLKAKLDATRRGAPDGTADVDAILDEIVLWDHQRGIVNKRDEIGLTSGDFPALTVT
jgi:hypothetical protein